MTFSIKNILIFFLLMLPLANFPQLFNLGEDLGSIYISIFIFIIFCFWVMSDGNIKLPTRKVNKILLSIIMIGIFLDIIAIITSTVPIQEGILVLLTFSLPKLLFLYLIIIIAERISLNQASHIINIFAFLMILSVLISPLFYPLNPIPEFIFYDGGSRFAGFHFELVNFSFSILIGFFIFSLRYKFSILFLLLVLIFLYFLASSNAFYPFALLCIFGALIGKFRLKLTSRFFIVGILLLTPIIGLFLDYFEFLEIFALRETTSFSLEGSALFIRLYPWALAMEHFIGNFLSLPIGLGMLNLSPFIEDKSNLFGGTGITAIIAEYGFLSVPIFYFFYQYFRLIAQNILQIPDANSRICLMAILTLCITYICIQSGFFNLTAWCLCIIVQTISIKIFSEKNKYNP